jgi:hypothetical protein
MEGFLALHWHGAHNDGSGRPRESYVVLDIVRDSRAGQFDLYFCSPGCLRAFLNACVDALEARIAHEQILPALKKARTRFMPSDAGDTSRPAPSV